ncbi:unnamed protein product, partial [Porites evermanni]
MVDGVLVFCTVWRRTQLLWPSVELPCSSQLTQAFRPPNWVYSSKARDAKSGINLIQSRLGIYIVLIVEPFKSNSYGGGSKNADRRLGAGFSLRKSCSIEV